MGGIYKSWGGGAMKEGSQGRVWGQKVERGGRGRPGGLKPVRCGGWRMRGVDCWLSRGQGGQCRGEARVAGDESQG